MTHDIVSSATARQRPTGLTARIAGIVALVLLLLNRDALSSDSAAPRPVAPHAGPTAAALLSYLDGLPLRANGRCLTGQEVGANGSPDEARAKFQDHVIGLERETGRRPAVLEYAVFHLDGRRMTGSEQKAMQAEILTRWREGHLIYLSLRPGHPAGLPMRVGRDWNTKHPDFYLNDASALVQPEGLHAQRYRADLAYAADFVAPLQDAGVPLLFELFNEFNGDWNWMGKAEPEEFKKLWRYTFDYFARERQFSNLLFVLEYSSNTLQREAIPANDYYPGNDCVDVVGFDFYHDDPQDKYLDVYQQLLAFGKPVAMTEYGFGLRKYCEEHNISRNSDKAIKVWDNLVQLHFTTRYYPKLCFFIRWGGAEAIASQKNASNFMSDPWWVDLQQFKQDAQTGGWSQNQ